METTKNEDILMHVHEAIAFSRAVKAMLKQNENYDHVEVVQDSLCSTLLVIEYLLKEKAKKEHEAFGRLVAENARTNLGNLGGLAVAPGKIADAMRLDSILEEGGGGLHG